MASLIRGQENTVRSTDTVKKRPAGLIVIVVYKACVALLLAITSIALLLALKNHQALAAFSASYVLEGKAAIIDRVLDRVLRIEPRTLKFSGITVGVYAGITAIEAVGLWYEKVWAEFLVLGLTGIGIPLEIIELSHGISPLKLTIFVINAIVFVYFFQRVMTEITVRNKRKETDMNSL